MDFLELMEACGGAFGNSSPAPDETGRCRIRVNGVEVTLCEDDRRGLITVRCAAGNLPTHGTARFRRAMLHANFMGRDTAGAQIAVSAEDEIVLAQTLPLAITDAETLVLLVRTLVALAAEWRKLAGEYESVAACREDEAEENRRIARRMVASAFLRV